MQSHGNFAENAPLGILLSALAELRGSPRPLVHAIGGTMLIGRLAYAYASGVPAEELKKQPNRVYSRIWGMGLTYASLAAGSVASVGLPAVCAWLAWGLFVAVCVTTGPTRSPLDKKQKK